MDEEALIRSSKLGDLAAFNRLVEHYQGQVYNLALRMLRDAAAAEDIAQETFFSAHRNLNSFKAGNFRAWIMRIAANGCRDYLRSARVRRSISLDAIDEGLGMSLESDLESPEAFALRHELSGVIQTGLTRLPTDQRLALILIDVQGFSYEEAAQAMRVPIGTVKSRLSRARLGLREYLLTQRELLPSTLRLG
jgi:RNA polymerase sigma-70 factor (ECF subfamily)